MMSDEDEIGGGIGAADLAVCIPGEDIAFGDGVDGTDASVQYLRGHGTYEDTAPDSDMDGDRSKNLVAAVAGVVERVNRLVSVKPMRARYAGDVGDVVVGRITGIGNKRWRVDVDSIHDAVLLLGSVNLPGGALRRRTIQDRLQMRTLFREGDLISAEVGNFFQDGSMSIHTRSLKYGKLMNGQLVRIPCKLVKRVKRHFVSLPAPILVDLVLGVNGSIFLTETPPSQLTEQRESYAERNQIAEKIEADIKNRAERTIGADARRRIANVRNAIVSIASRGQMVSPDAIIAEYCQLDERMQE